MSIFAQVTIPYLLFFFIFCLDLWIFFAVGMPTSALLLSLLIATLFLRPFSWSLTLWTMLLLMSAAQTMGLPAWWPLITALPFCLIVLAIRSHVFGHPLYPALIAGLCLAIDFLALRPLLLGKIASPFYTIGIIFGTMILTMVFSLKLKTGRTGQSLTHA